MLFECVGATARDAQQPVVGRRRELACLGYGFGFKVKQRGHAGGRVPPHVRDLGRFALYSATSKLAPTAAQRGADPTGFVLGIQHRF